MPSHFKGSPKQLRALDAFIKLMRSTESLNARLVALLSRSGITQMGYELATRLGLCLFGRATNKHFICYCGFERFDSQPEPVTH